MVQVKSPIILLCAFLWIGFVCAISFMEAWLKFRAPGITIPLGLGIGRLVFGALNKMEWIFALTIVISMFLNKMITADIKMLLFTISLLTLLLQTVWLLPVLDVRAELYLTGKQPAHAFYHIYYIIAEILKVACLFLFGIKLFLSGS